MVGRALWRTLRTLAGAALLTACGARASGPHAWIDKPIDGSSLPLAPVIVQAHAAEASGVAGIAIYVNGELINQGAAGGQVLGEVVVEWSPPSAGIYTVEARALDSAGNAGPPALARVTIGEEAPAPAAGTPAAPAESALPAELPTNTLRAPTSTSAPAVQPTFEPPPFEPETGEPPTAEPPTAEPPADNAPPSIVSYDASPGQILKEGPGCSNSPRTTTVTVVATDPSGVSEAMVFWNVSGDTGEADLTSVGGNTYQGEAGPVSKTGSMSLFVAVKDGVGNSALTGVMQVNVQQCIQ